MPRKKLSARGRPAKFYKMTLAARSLRCLGKDEFVQDFRTEMHERLGRIEDEKKELLTVLDSLERSTALGPAAKAS